MINQLRTLLLNVTSQSRSGGFCAEFIDPVYVPVDLPQSLSGIRSIMFGSDPDELTLNYRVTQYLSLIDADPVLSGYVIDMDPRKTYRLDRWANYEFMVTAPSTFTNSMLVSGDHQGDDEHGHNIFSYSIAAYGEASEYYASISQVSGAQRIWYRQSTTPVFDLPLNADNSKSGLTVSINQADGPDVSSHVTSAQFAQWLSDNPGKELGSGYVYVTCRPSRTLPQIYGQLAESGLMNWSNPLEPYVSLEEIFLTGETLCRRLAAAALMLGIKTGELSSVI